MDASLTCAQERPDFRPTIATNARTGDVSDASYTGDGSSTGKPYCGTLTDITPPLGQDEPGGIIMLPVFPADDTAEIVAFIGSSILWGDVLEMAFNTKVSGVDVVLQTSASPLVAYTYRVVAGKAHYLGPTDMHDASYDQYRRRTILTDAGGHTKYLSEPSPEYYMTIYPSADLFAVFSTQNPKLATVGAVIIIFFTSLLFFLYDALVSQQNQKNQAIIEGRRRFMRFVSHEVRTPLNSVCMGLKLLKEEVTALFENASPLGSDADIAVVATASATHRHHGDHRGQTRQPRSGGAGHHKRDSSFLPKLSEDDLESYFSCQDDNHPLNNTSSTSHPNNNTGNDVDKDDDDDELILRANKGQKQEIIHLSKQVLGSVSSAIDVLNDLLNYDKIETGQLQLEKSVLLEFGSLAGRVLQEFELPFKAKNIRYKVLDLGNSATEMTKDQKRIVGDSMKITQVFRNILSNALKFTPDGGTVTVQSCVIKPTLSDGTVMTQTSQEDTFTLSFSRGEEKASFPRSGFLQVQITDTGAGMNEDQVSKLFRAGVQFNSNKLQAGQGSGLGLFIAKEIMRKHDGDLTASSDGLGQGATFTMTIPIYYIPNSHPAILRAIPKAHTIDTAESGATNGQKSKPKPSLKVLVVDDAVTNRKLLTRLLERQGHVLDQAEDGVEGLAKVSQALQPGQRPFDSILLDYEMPNMDGPTAAQKMRQIANFDALIVGITGNVLPEDIAHFKKCGADHVLPKPLDIPNLNRLWEEAGLKA